MAVFSKLFTTLVAISLLGFATASEPPSADAPSAHDTQASQNAKTEEAPQEEQRQYSAVSLDFPKPHALVTPSVISNLRRDGTCPANELVIMPPLPEDFRPWTHIPYCMNPNEKKQMMFCAATSAGFHEGRGISIMAFAPYAKDMERTTALGKKFSVRGGEKKYEMIKTPKKGNGLFVKEGKSIKAGEVIIVDYPTLTVSRDINEYFAPDERQRIQWMGLLQLPEAGREATRSLESHGRYEDELDNLITKNAIGVTINNWKFVSVFPEVARVNHACIANSYYRYNETTFALELFALKDIGEGEEITISYVDPNHGVKFNDRYNLLGSQWGFECDCKICKSPARRAESDKRRTKINKLRKILSDQSEEGGDLEMMVECAEELLELYHEDGMIVPRAMTAEIIAYTYNQLGEADKAVKYGKMAVEYHKIMAGEASNEVKRVQELVDAPKLHGSWKPKSDAGDVLDEERLARDEGDVNADKADKGSEEDAVMAAVRAAMAKAKKVAREEGVSKETEDLLVEEAVKAALKQVKSE